ncbi:MAG: alginate lyase family protein [Marinilabiliales bacterium]|nr:alginate lyase family protein [Marinilabiliales bacterium]
MKKQVEAGLSPWKAAFDKLKSTTDTTFKVIPHAHVLRGPYGKPNIGGDDLSKGAGMAYNCALMWYLTGDSHYSRKAIEILNGWSTVLWDFDYNDAKLLAGWTGHQLCNAAEILRYGASGWSAKGISDFTRMLMQVYYPLIRYYYPQANGNWDGAIIHSLLALAIFTDNREIYDNALEHFYHAPVNGSIFKYIYPDGQCQESTRDQGHVQLGLGEFAGAAKVAFTQGTDLFSIADHRIGLGFEYTASYLLGHAPHCYGKISDRALSLRDDYEYVYRHYAARGIDLPYTKMAADSVRPQASRSVLTAFRATDKPNVKPINKPSASAIAYPAGAEALHWKDTGASVIRVKPGESLQEAIDKAAGTGNLVLATAGLHKFPATLKIPSGTTLVGEGLSTILMLDPASGQREAMIQATDDLHDVVLQGFVLEGSTDPDPGTDPNSRRSYRGNYNRGGILFYGNKTGSMKNITVAALTIRNCTFNGLFITGADKVNIQSCDLNENGVSVPSGSRQLHNLLLSHCRNVNIQNCRLDTSPLGCGIHLADCTDALIEKCEVARNGWHGILLSACQNILITGNLVEANDGCGTLIQYLGEGSVNVRVVQNILRYNHNFGLLSYGGTTILSVNNRYEGNGIDLKSDEMVSPDPILMLTDL